MGKTNIVLLLFMVLFSIAIAAHGDLIADKKWILGYLKRAPKVTQLQLYAQDILSGPVPTNIVVAAPNSSSTSPTFFGMISVLDDPVRTAPNPNAEIVGQVEGLFAFASLDVVRIQMTFDLVFVGGAYNGSSLSVVGHNAYLQPYRELSIVGGSGVFRLARGLIGIRTVFLNSTNGDAFFEYNVTVIH